MTNLSVAINVLHMLPPGLDDELPHHVLGTITTDATEVLHRCHLALDLDGRSHGYTADEWLPMVYDIARPLLEPAAVSQEPPPVVHHTQDAVRWLSRAIISAEQDSPDTPAALTDALGRLLVTFVFVRLADDRGTPPPTAAA